MKNNVITKLEELNLLDRFLFSETMEDRDACQAAVSILLEKEAPFDLFGRDLYRYTFEGVCQECPDLKLEDGAVRIFINTKGENRQDFSQEFLDFMEYINTTTDQAAGATASSKIKLIHDQVKKVKLSEKMGVKYMQLWEEKAYLMEDARAEGLELGRTEGLELGRAEGIIEGIAKGIAALILDNLEDGKDQAVIIDKLNRHFSLSPEEALDYYHKYAGASKVSK